MLRCGICYTIQLGDTFSLDCGERGGITFCHVQRATGLAECETRTLEEFLGNSASENSLLTDPTGSLEEFKTWNLFPIVHHASAFLNAQSSWRSTGCRSRSIDRA